MIRYSFLLLLALLAVLIDQISKSLAYQHLLSGPEIDILPVFKLALAFNSGAAFGILDDAGGWQRYLFIALAVGFSLILLVWIWRERERNLFLGVGLSLVLGGAIGNLIDRILTGTVIDFFVLYYEQWYFPTFNVADVAITLGAMILIIDTLFPRQRR